MSVSNQTRAYGYALIAVLLWSTVASAFKISLRYLDTWQLLLVASITATSCLLLILVYQKKLALLHDLKQDDLARLLGFGILNPFCYYLVLLKAYVLLPAQVAQPLNYTWAITLMFLSIPILKHKVTRYDVLATLICYAGVVVICLGGSTFPTGNLNILGIFLALGSTIIWAIYWLFKTRDRIDPVIGLFVSFLFSLPLITIACYLFSDLFSWNLTGVAGGIYVGLFEMGITFVFWLSALQLTRSVGKNQYIDLCITVFVIAIHS